MVRTLEKLANNIAALREDGTRSGDAQVEFIAELMASRFALMLDEFAQREGALNGEMPWVESFRNRPTNR
jgi:hypothetical protein